MKNVLIINGHQPGPYSPGKLNATLVSAAREQLEARGYEVKVTVVAEDGWDVETEISTHLWADAIIMQFPVNWMGTPWCMKKYMDDVYTAAIDGRMCTGDGRSKEDPKSQYGTSGALKATRYMLSLTFNAPADAFNDPNQVFFEGRSVDDLMLPMHLNAKFFAMTPLPTFSSHDVWMRPEIEKDLERFREHLESAFPAVE